MIIEVHEVPDAALAALLEAAPADTASRTGREEWRQALAAALTQWEKTRPRDVVPPVYAATAHECTWRALAVQHRDMMLGVKQTDVTMKCDGCGDLTSRTLNGTVTLEQVRG